ncbi:hypothetical protein Pint_14513 [Pistacia integerrima]|uniref:Uncharacterized protein n=1 Tax=Pistacia integerrima TaxID=434235 RepID=A0ACC0Y9F7_9ROSI|nr:hypothetical protein Pint_14513 [Pistacia integerrima]
MVDVVIDGECSSFAYFEIALRTQEFSLYGSLLLWFTIILEMQQLGLLILMCQGTNDDSLFYCT